MEKGRGVFAKDETQAVWRREENTEILNQFCPEGYKNAQKYRHFIIGTSRTGNYIGIPGRFLKKEQPADGKTGFTLWQPLKGGETYYDSLEEMDEVVSYKIYGYWIARIDGETLAISEV